MFYLMELEPICDPSSTTWLHQKYFSNQIAKNNNNTKTTTDSDNSNLLFWISYSF